MITDNDDYKQSEEKPGKVGMMQRMQTATESFEKEKRILTAKYKKKRTELVNRGIFDTDVNTIRAENMLLTAVGKIRMQTLNKEHALREKESSSFNQTTKDEVQRPVTDTSIAGRLETELNKRYVSGVNELHDNEEERKRRCRTTCLKKGITSTKKGEKSEKKSPSPAQPELRTLPVIHPTGDNRNNKPQAEVVSFFTEQADAKKEEARAPKSRLGKKSEPTTHNIEFTAAEWLQKQWEHRSYANISQRQRKRAKQLDGQSRATDIVGRYTEPRAWMSGAAKVHEQQPGTVRRDSDITPPLVPGVQQWERNAVFLSVESMLYSPSLVEIIDPDLVKSSEKETEQHQSPKHPTYSPQRAIFSNQSLDNPSGNELRRLFKYDNEQELYAQKHAVHSNLKTHQSVQNPISENAEEDSSDDEPQRTQTEFPDSKDESGGYTSSLETLSIQREVLKLLETTITFLCKEITLRKKGRGNQMSYVRVTRNLLIQSLKSLLPAISDTTDSEIATTAAIHSKSRCQKKKAAAAKFLEMLTEHRLSVLRTWSKGVEVLFTLELGISEPFTPQSEFHLTQLVKYYCTLRIKVRERTTSLMNRWKKSKIETDVGSDTGIAKKEANRALEIANKKRELAIYLSKAVQHENVSCINDTIRAFMERYGFVPSAEGLSDIRGKKPPNGAAADIISKLLMSDRLQATIDSHSSDHDESESELNDSTYKNEPKHEVHHQDQRVPTTSVYNGAVVPNFLLFTVSVDLTNAFSCKKDSGMVTPGSAKASLIKSPYKKGCLLNIISIEGGWVQMINGYWIKKNDTTQLEQSSNQVLQQSADNVNMSVIVGEKESRMRQRALLYNELIAVVHGYLRISPRCIQERFVNDVEFISSQPRVLEEEGRLHYMFTSEDLSSLSSSELQQQRNIKNQQQRDREHNAVIQDILIRKYRPCLKKKAVDILRASNLWSNSFQNEDPTTSLQQDLNNIEEVNLNTLLQSSSSDDNDNSNTADDVQLSKYLSEIDSVLASLKMTFAQKHVLTSKYGSQCGVRELKIRLKLWKAAQVTLFTRENILQKLIQNMGADPSIINNPSVMMNTCRKILSLGSELDKTCAKLRQITGDTLTYAGIPYHEKLSTDYAAMISATEKAKDTPAAQMLRSYLENNPVVTGERESYNGGSPVS